jgi:DNA-binding transcriptional ArsR family regulator
VPLELIDSGLAREMGASEFQRYIILLRLANFRKTLVVSESLEDLERKDGLSPRSASRINARLEERGLVRIDRNRNPFKYTLLKPSEWKKLGEPWYPTGNFEPAQNREKIEAPPWR